MNTPAVKPVGSTAQSRDGIPNDEAYFQRVGRFSQTPRPLRTVRGAASPRLDVAAAMITQVVGRLRVVESAMAAAAWPCQSPINLSPIAWRRYRGRKVWQLMLGELRMRCGTGRPSEPAVRQAVPPQQGLPPAFYDAADLDGVSHPRRRRGSAGRQSGRCSRRSGGATFVAGRLLEIVAIRQGADLSTSTSRLRKSVKAAVVDFESAARRAATHRLRRVDRFGRTVLVEVDDGYSLGSYGIERRGIIPSF